MYVNFQKSLFFFSEIEFAKIQTNIDDNNKEILYYDEVNCSEA